MSTTESFVPPVSAAVPAAVPATAPATAPSGASATAPSDLARASSDLRMATFRLARRLRSERAIDAMSDGQFAVLATLKVHGPQSLGELAERERVSSPSMNRTVNCLEESGYVARTPDAGDRRRVTVSLTDAGIAVVTETTRRRDSWLESALGELTAAQRETLAAAASLMREVAGA